MRPPDQWFAQARRCGLGPAARGARDRRRARACRAGRPARSCRVNVSPGTLVSEEVARGAARRSAATWSSSSPRTTSSRATRRSTPSSTGCAQRGARIAVDDAGAGYAGLQQMVRIKPDILKLDRSLISGIHRDASKIALLEAMARFATTTGAAVCAEGIEEIDELRVLGPLRRDLRAGLRARPSRARLAGSRRRRGAVRGDRRDPLGHARAGRRGRPPAARSRSATSPTPSVRCGRAPTSTARVD